MFNHSWISVRGTHPMMPVIKAPNPNQLGLRLVERKSMYSDNRIRGTRRGLLSRGNNLLTQLPNDMNSSVWEDERRC